MLVGLTGQNGSGKGAVAEILQAVGGFSYCSLSDALRDEARARGEEITRTTLQRLGTELRRAEGPEALAHRILNKVQAGGDWVIDSIRNPAEAEVLTANGVTLWRVIAAPEVRYERLIARGREGEPQTLDAFKRSEATENQTADAAGLQIAEVEKMATMTIINECTLDELRAVVNCVLEVMKKETTDE